MFLTEIPAFIFLHDEKIDCPIRVGVCHFLCDRGYTWEHFIASYPLSFWVACDRRTVSDIREKMIAHLNLGDWIVGTYADATTTPIVLAHNAPFRSACQKVGVRMYEQL